MISLATALQILGFIILLVIQAMYFIQRLSKLEEKVEERTKQLEQDMTAYAKLEQKFLDSHKILHEKIESQNDKMIAQNKELTKLIHDTNLVMTELKTQFGYFTDAFKEFKDAIKK